MFRTRGAVVLVVAAALIAGACGGTDWNAGQKAKPLSAAEARAAAAAQKKAELPYVNALVAKFSPDAGNAADQRCFATAVVHGYGVSSFTSHGMTAAGLRNPRTTLDDLPTPSLDQVNAMGAAMQRCRLSLLAGGIAIGLGVPNRGTVSCLTRALAQPEARRFLGLAVLGRHRVNLATAHTMVGLIAGCVDLAALVVRAVNLPADPSIRQCVATAIRGADAELKDLMALKLADADPDQVQQAGDALGIAINQCRPGAQTGFTVPPN
jgi:hypothetical protein